AFGSAVLDQVVVVDRILGVRVVEVQSAGGLSAMSCKQRVEESVERRQLGAVTKLQATDRDVTRGVAVELNAGAVAVEREPAVHLGSAHRSDDAQPAARDRNLLISAVCLAAQLLGPGFQLAAFLIDTAVKVDRADVGILEHI